MDISHLFVDGIGLFIVFAGYVIGLGAVTVIDMHGFRARHSSYWTQTTIRAHKITKPLIWVGTGLLLAGLLVVYRSILDNTIPLVHLGLVVVLILNGCYLSFVVSPALLQRERNGKDTELLPAPLQRGITTSFIVSVVGWWGSLGLFVFYLITHPFV